MRKHFGFFLGTVAGACLTLLVASPQGAHLFAVANAAAHSDNTYSQLNLFGEVFEKIKTDYVEKPEDSKLVEGAINGMISSLDPHSRYMNEKGWAEMQETTHGEFGGLGIEVTMEDGFVKVVAPIDDTPASRAGIMSGDVITSIDDEQIQGLTLDQAVNKMKGAPNSSIRLKIVRKDADKPIELSITREIIRVRPVKYHVEGGDIGYVRITSFNEQTTDGLRKAIGEIQKEVPQDKLAGYVVDLRNNPGGLLDQAVSVTSTLMQRGEVVSTRGRNPEETQRFTAHGGDMTKGKPLVVLINGGSASASEIVAGALHDHKRATLIGTRSFGKGSVQTIIPLGAGNGALALTTARYFTPSGHSIQALGIKPDIEVLQDVPDEFKTRSEIKGEASMRGHLSAEGAEQTGSQSYVPPDEKNDKALAAAFNQLRGVTVNADAKNADTKTAQKRPVPN
ncbi:S41 family peptidase [Bradyrhizobium viridifuturi]|jgi:carboxyl-terminal processing protease|uniref:S41 family peptidase n=1 Tax=Bradyrhizobium TaxID=374 RepID=UPI0003962D6A|nr:MULTISPECIES: S41 family peptidase [Bradyrhizobium]ERF85742.1 MAG: C-terminal processing peptidase [Bradyrhizobium sp. DFCI-1]OYU63088.1 MAG: peptidase S41 [Bradyrhizobium sp. PARBB1]PSO23534.1 S41 family peptidase [Bradyrhizobium sp. MOS004]QRI73104.1 S41 family peptidase [Bradyrhizobium sp. PSBB068]MBR1019417.1 S41 family peptidase [Bradyrhizobium viridifuturi]